MRSAELTSPGFVHDVCSAIPALALAAPFFKSVDLAERGVDLIHPRYPFAHPLDDGTAVVAHRSVEETARGLGVDESAYRSLMAPLVTDAPILCDALLGPPRLPGHPMALARFGRSALRSADALFGSRFHGDRARALLGGVSAHSMMRLTSRPTAAFGLMLATVAHAYGWPVVRGGMQELADALVEIARDLGVEVHVDRPIAKMSDLPPSRAVMFDLTPRQLVAIAGEELPGWYRRVLRGFRYGPGVCKLDLALDGPVPWKAEECAGAGTVHVAGPLADIVASEEASNAGVHSDRPYVLLCQQSLFDPTRAPEGKHTVWAYCHVPSGSTVDMTDRIEQQIERFAPGFRDRIIARHVTRADELERYNPNYIGGDINGGVQDFRQLMTRPNGWWPPYATPNKRIYLCSSSTPPGGGIHGMCGWNAAQVALRRALR
jgi:phytoene dehydrogenase-like protein